MVGVGETDEEVLETLADLRKAQVDVVTVGQYLRPSPKHAPVERYVTPQQFAEFERAGMALGFSFVGIRPTRALELPRSGSIHGDTPPHSARAGRE